MSIAKTVINKPTTFLILYSLLVGLAIYIVPQVPLDLFPEISPPVLVVSTKYSGAGPKEVEQSVTRPMEGTLTNVGGVKKITSTSSEGNSQIVLEFSWGANLAEATNEVRDKLEFVKDFLPDKAATPQIFKFDPSLIPVVSLSMEGERSPEELRQIAEKQVIPRLEQVDGVALVSLIGGRERAIRIEVSQNRLESYGITLAQVSAALASQNVQLSAGAVYEGNSRYLVETQGLFSNLDDIRNAVITYKGASINPLTGSTQGQVVPIQLRDLADVTDAYKDVENSLYVNGKPGIYITLQKQSGTNSVEVANRINAEWKNIETLLPSNVSLTLMYDTSKIIRRSLSRVSRAALLGAALAMAVLFFFLRNIKSTIIIGFSIPISLLVTIMVMYFSGLTLNIMTLAGLSLGIGMLVDSSIVILENIYRYRAKGAKAKAAAFLGSKEMVTAITASILTTVGIFLPLLMFKKELDVIGVLFQDLSLTIVITLLASLLVAITLVPVLSSKYLKLYTRKQRPIKIRFFRAIDNAMEKGFIAMTNGYKRVLTHVLHHKGLSIIIMALILILSIFTLEPLGGNIGVELMPSQAQDLVQIDINLPVGTRYEVTEKIMIQLADIAQREVEGYQDIFIQAGVGGDAFGNSSSNRGVLYITLPPYDQQVDSYDTIVEKMRAHYDEFPSVNFRGTPRSMMGGNSSPIDILLKTENLDKAKILADEISELLEKEVDEVIEPRISINDGLPIAGILIDRDKAYALGLNINTIANEISGAIDGNIAGRYRTGGDEIDIMVILQKQDRSSIPDLGKIFVASQTGERIPVSAFARVERSTGPVDIDREDRSRVIHVTAKQAPGISLNVAEEAVQQAIEKNIIVDDDIILEYSGDFADLLKYIIKFVVIMVLALALVYGIMASLFESLKDPFIIFISIFMIIPGILLMYSFMNLPFFGLATPLSMFSAVGLLMLVGIAVNNGIVLVDYMNLLRDRGMRIWDAAIEACGNRLRPVLMTSLTTILGMVPLAFGQGEGSEMVRPIGQTIVGGMLMSSLMTLFLVPIIYVHMHRKFDSKRLKISPHTNPNPEKNEA